LARKLIKLTNLHGLMVPLLLMKISPMNWAVIQEEMSFVSLLMTLYSKILILERNYGMTVTAGVV